MSAAIQRSFAGLSFHELDNGVRIALDPRGDTSLVTVAVSVSVGSRDQPADWTGLAHLTEHLMFRPRARDPLHFVDRLERLGSIEHNGMTSRDRTVYFETVPASALAEVLWMEAERFANVITDLDAEAVSHEREIVLRERELREAQRRIGPSLLFRELYPRGHPYAEAHLERTWDLRAIGLREVQSFLQRAYVPSNLTIAISGRFEPAAALLALNETFGALRPAAPSITPPSTAVPGLSGERRLLIDMPRAHDQLSIVWPTPPYGTDEDAALDLAAILLEEEIGRGLSSLGLDVSVWQGSGDITSEFSVTVEVPRRLGTLVPLEIIDAALLRRQQRPPSSAELDHVREVEHERIARMLTTSRERALILSRAPPRFAEGRYDPRRDLERYDRVDPALLFEVFRRWLPRNDRLVVSLNADARAPFEGRLVTSVVVR